ncbi:MAG TPA: GDP-mannose 4,6-dehydratase [Candidatus Omnitrophota bacterium]|nr:GDP-mannose 4,6-dehydratase [Candidatus Omnitrophota bacterium]
MVKKAFITGIAGQDGSYLSELLLEKGYQVFGLVYPESSENDSRDLWRIQHLLDKIEIFSGSILDGANILKIIHTIKPDECYHLAAKSFVSYSFDDAFSLTTTNINGTLNVLSAIKDVTPECRFYFAGSSEMFGLADSSPQHEETKFNPRSLYGISKVSGFYLTKNYRNFYGMFACNGILYNHESPRREEIFVTRKITKAVAEIKKGIRQELRLGNLDAMRDWGYAKDYVYAIWLMLQQNKADDYVVATGQLHSVRDFVKIAFDYVGLDWKKYVIIDDKFFRPGEKVELCGNAEKARNVLGWNPTKTLEEIIKMMVDADLESYG